MATSKPTSTISYNTEGFLREHLDQWYKAHYIQAYQYICHIGEDGDKNHIHLRIEPNKALDVMKLTEDLTEYVQGETKPRVVRPWRPSKEEDWILYAVHDPDYMRIKYGSSPKGEKLPYKWQDVRASEGYDVETMYIRAKQALERSSANLMKRLQDGEGLSTLVAEGNNVFQLNALQRAVGYQEIPELKRQINRWAEKCRQYELWFLENGYSIDWKSDGTLDVQRDISDELPDSPLPEQFVRGPRPVGGTRSERACPDDDEL